MKERMNGNMPEATSFIALPNHNLGMARKGMAGPAKINRLFIHSIISVTEVLVLSLI